MIVLLNGKRFEATLIKMPAANVMVMGMPALRMRQGQPMHEVRQLAVAPRPKDKMPVVGHQAVADQAHAGNMVLGFSDNALERLIVGILAEDRDAAVAAVED